MTMTMTGVEADEGDELCERSMQKYTWGCGEMELPFSVVILSVKTTSNYIY